jgi:DNA ligase 1
MEAERRGRKVNSFVNLFLSIDQSNSTLDKVEALREYFKDASPIETAWATALLSGRRPRVPVKRKVVRAAAEQMTGLPSWLFDECYAAVGDMSETLSLLVAKGSGSNVTTLTEWMTWTQNLARQEEEAQISSLHSLWAMLSRSEVFVFHKIIGGGFRVGVSKELVHRALGGAFGIDKAVVAHRLMGDWEPSDRFVEHLMLTDGTASDSKPFPFCLAHPLEGDISNLQGPEKWLLEWKWDGIRAQLLRRNGKTYLWSRGEELLDDGFPEIRNLGEYLPDGTVLDGEIVVWDGDKPGPFANLQRRITRKTPSAKLLKEVPCVLLAFDLLEMDGIDQRLKPLSERRAALENLILDTAHPSIRVSPAVIVETWEEAVAMRNQSRDQRAEGLMVKSLDSTYSTGRKRGIWWKWKLEPYSIDAVLVYAQRGSGKRASLYTDYTFAVWQGERLVPFAKAYSGLTNEEIAQVDRFIRANVEEKFGPVRTVKPELVFEIAFEGIQASSRHKSGISVRFPRISRWRKDKLAKDANTLDELKELLRVRD